MLESKRFPSFKHDEMLKTEISFPPTYARSPFVENLIDVFQPVKSFDPTDTGFFGFWTLVTFTKSGVWEVLNNVTLSGANIKN